MCVLGRACRRRAPSNTRADSPTTRNPSAVSTCVNSKFCSKQSGRGAEARACAEANRRRAGSARRAACRGFRTGSLFGQLVQRGERLGALAVPVAGVAHAAKVGVEVEHRGHRRMNETMASSRSRGREAKRRACIIRGRRKRRWSANFPQRSQPAFSPPVSWRRPQPRRSHTIRSRSTTRTLTTSKRCRHEDRVDEPARVRLLRRRRERRQRRWSMELDPPVLLRRYGWSKETVSAWRLDRDRRAGAIGREDHARSNLVELQVRNCAFGRAFVTRRCIRTSFRYYAQLIVCALFISSVSLAQAPPSRARLRPDRRPSIMGRF